MVMKVTIGCVGAVNARITGAGGRGWAEGWLGRLARPSGTIGTLILAMILSSLHFRKKMSICHLFGPKALEIGIRNLQRCDVIHASYATCHARVSSLPKTDLHWPARRPRSRFFHPSLRASRVYPSPKCVRTESRWGSPINGWENARGSFETPNTSPTFGVYMTRPPLYEKTWKNC